MCCINEFRFVCTKTLSFNVAWDAIKYKPNISISVNKKNFTAYLRPYCLDMNNKETDKVIISVFRREFDGSFTEIISNIENNKIHILLTLIQVWIMQDIGL